MNDRFDRFAEDLQEIVIKDAKAYYTEKVINLWLNPQNVGPLEHPDGYAKVKGPCGDTMEIFLRITGDRVARAIFTTNGCGPTVAAGRMSTRLATGQTLSEAENLTGDDIPKALGGLPEESRHCAILAARTLTEAIQRYLSTQAARKANTTIGKSAGPNTPTVAEDPRDC